MAWAEPADMTHSGQIALAFRSAAVSTQSTRRRPGTRLISSQARAKDATTEATARTSAFTSAGSGTGRSANASPMSGDDLDHERAVRTPADPRTRPPEAPVEVPLRHGEQPHRAEDDQHALERPNTAAGQPQPPHIRSGSASSQPSLKPRAPSAKAVRHPGHSHRFSDSSLLEPPSGIADRIRYVATDTSAAAAAAGRTP